MSSSKESIPAVSAQKHQHESWPWKKVLIAALSLTAGAKVYSQWNQEKVNPAQDSMFRYFVDQITTTEIKQFKNSLSSCREIKTPYAPSEASSSRVNPRWKADDPNKGAAISKSYLLGNATLFDGKSFLDDTVDILIRDGVFKSIVPSGFSIPSSLLGGGELETVDLAGKHVTPGLIDLHSHLGMMPRPYLRGDGDTNEVTAAITSYVRAIDGFSPLDPAIQWSASGGVTTALVLPGSANNIGGEAIAVKLHLPESSLVEDMLVEKDVKGKRRRYMKMACGENPKNVHRNRPGYGSGKSEIPPGPSTRMGSAYHLRQHFDKARSLLQAQDLWCEKAESISSSFSQDIFDEDDLEPGDKAYIRSLGELPSEISLESTVAILRDEVLVNVHCYLGQDLETMIRVADEFDFRVTAFHHALSASRVSKFLAEHRSTQNITVAMFAENALYKAEAYDHDLRSGAVLAESGISVVYKSDNPAVDPKYLMREAAFAHHFDLDADLSIAAVTSTPANAMGLGHRIGYVREGYDADLVIWDDYPLAIGATPVNVFIDGQKLYSDDQLIKPKVSLDGLPKSQTHANEISYRKHGKSDQTQAQNEKTCEKTRIAGDDLIVKGIRRSFLNPTSHLEPNISYSRNLSLIIQSGKVSCFGDCEKEEQQILTTNKNTPTIWLENGHVLPPITSVSQGLGQLEIEAEDSTSVGSFIADSYGDADKVIYTKDSLVFGGKVMSRARYGGVYKAITPPLSSGFLAGVSVAFKTDGQNLLQNGTIVKDAVALHVTLGSDALNDKMPSKAQQVKALREILSKNKDKDNVYGEVVAGKLPLAVNVGAKAQIYQVIGLKKTFPQVKFVILGGAEAWMAAKDLAVAKIPVILRPWTCNGEGITWEIRDCFRGPPLTEATSTILRKAGVEFAIGPKGDIFSLSLITDASWAAGAAGMSSQEAVNLVSYNIEKIFDLPVSKSENGERQDFVVWEGNPLQFGARIAMVVDEVRGASVLKECWPPLV